MSTEKKGPETLDDIIADLNRKIRNCRGNSNDERISETCAAIALLLEPIVMRLEMLKERSAFFTSKAALDAILANPPTGGGRRRTSSTLAAFRRSTSRWTEHGRRSRSTPRSRCTTSASPARRERSSPRSRSTARRSSRSRRVRSPAQSSWRAPRPMPTST